MARFFALVLTVFVTSAVEEAAPVARAEVSTALRVEDRTVVCATQIVAGVRKFSSGFQPLQPPSGNLPLGFPASVSVTTGFVSASRALVFAVLVRARVVSIGSYATQAELAVRTEKSGTPVAYVRIDRSGSGVFYSSPRCD